MFIYEPEPGLPYWLETLLEQVLRSQLHEKENKKNNTTLIKL
jgi:hypothetical protein